MQLHRQLLRTIRLLNSGLIALFLVLGASEAHALATIQESPVLTSRLLLEATSDAINQQTLGLAYRNHRRDAFWPFPGEAVGTWDFGVRTDLRTGSNALGSYKGQEIQTLLARKLSAAVLLEGWLGFHHLGNAGPGPSKTIASFNFSSAWSPSDDLTVAVRSERELIYAELIQPGSITDAISATTETLDLAYRPLSRMRAILHGSTRNMSDTNSRNSFDLGIFYGLATTTPWIWIGFGAEKLSYDHRAQGYWSPPKFLSYGPRAEAAFDLPHSFSASIGINLNHSREDELAWSNGYYGSCRLQYGARDASHVELAYTRILSAQESTHWSSNALELTFTRFF